MHAKQSVQKVQPNEDDLCSSKDPLEDIFMCSKRNQYLFPTDPLEDSTSKNPLEDIFMCFKDPWEDITSGERYQT
jgi:hypothetical protein